MRLVSSASILIVASVLVLLSSQWLVFSTLSSNMSEIVPKVQNIIRTELEAKVTYTYTDTDGGTHTIVTNYEDYASESAARSAHMDRIDAHKEVWPMATQ